MSENGHLHAGSLLKGKTVAIVGGGPAGLTLARLLQLKGASVRVFERDVGPLARIQGGSLDLHEDSGQLALRQCELLSAFDAVSRPEGQVTTVVDKHGRRRASSSAENESEIKPEIDRGALRHLLLGSLEEGSLIWGHSLIELAPERQQSLQAGV